uniref:2-iminobutanoate/2-iminopropanoate deaminase n=1 Tax=Acrobeloides nanus TaxID=290746 RepID=A0A914DTT1_9BILA
MASLTRQIYDPKTTPPAMGPYSKAVRVNDTVYLAGVIGMDPSTNKLSPGGITAETHQALKNMGEVLKEAGISYENVVKTTVLLADIQDFGAMNEVYKQYFKSRFPARACFQVARHYGDARVGIEAIAVVGDIQDV